MTTVQIHEGRQQPMAIVEWPSGTDPNLPNPGKNLHKVVALAGSPGECYLVVISVCLKVVNENTMELCHGKGTLGPSTIYGQLSTQDSVTLSMAC